MPKPPGRREEELSWADSIVSGRVECTSSQTRSNAWWILDYYKYFQTLKSDEITVNVCKKKHMTAIRSAGKDEALRLVPHRILSLEQCLEFMADDELLEVTPKTLRLRKRILDHSLRMKALKKKDK